MLGVARRCPHDTSRDFRHITLLYLEPRALIAFRSTENGLDLRSPREPIIQPDITPWCRDWIARCPRDADAATVRALFFEVYGETIDDAWARWLEWL